MHRKIRDEYGSIAKLPGLLGSKGVVVVSDANDFEYVFRNEGIWPHRRGFASFENYRKSRPDVFNDVGGLISAQGEKWSSIRSIVNPIMLKPLTVNAYVSRVDEIAIEFVSRVKTLRDINMEMPANFCYELNKWALESIGVVALNQRLNILDDHYDNQNTKSQQLIKAVDEFFRLTFELELAPSLWRFYETSKYKQLMRSFDNLTEATLYFIDKSIQKFESEFQHNDDSYEPSVLEKLLKIDKNVAVVMAIDMLMAGVDTVCSMK